VPSSGKGIPNPRKRNSGTFRPGIDPKTGLAAMSPEQRKVRQREYYQRYKVRTTERNWERQIRALGCNPTMYQSLLSQQGHSCAICGRKQKKRLAVDHCHETRVVRGLLCSWCNSAIGLLKDDPSTIERAAHYVRTFKCQQT